MAVDFDQKCKSEMSSFFERINVGFALVSLPNETEQK
jgi:hypothetical protein